GVDTLYIAAVNTDINISYRLSFTPSDPVTGVYSIRGIPDGDYRIYLRPNNFNQFNAHIPQVYGGPECNFCSRIVYDGVGAVLNINSANTISNIDFSVNVGASISGSILDSDTSNPTFEPGFLMLFNDSNFFLGSGLINGRNIDPLADGSYSIGGLLPGSYYVQGGDLGREFYQRELYDNRPCYFAGCNRGAGDAVVLSALENEVGIDFLLNKGGKISGTVTDEITGMPIVLASNRRLWVEFYDAAEQVIGGAFVQTDGSYISARSLPAGDYSVRTGSMFQGDLTSPYVNEKYNDIPCAGLACDLSATNVTVVSEMITSGIDFALTTGNSFSGTVADLSSEAPIAGIHVLVYKEMSPGVVKFANWATTSDGAAGNPPIGTFEISGLPDGTYYARTHTGSDLPFFANFSSYWDTTPLIGWIDILYNNIPCIGDCDVTLGTPIILPAVVIKTSSGGGPTIDFALSQGATIAGQVTDFIQNAPIKEVSVEIYNDQGTFMGSSFSDDQGNYITRGLPAGTYYLITKSYDLLLDVKYGNEFCTAGSCNPLDATPIAVTVLEQKTNQNFLLKSAFMHMFSNDFE
ncbi:MAG: carboxypeptidase-like regulatory domain-containing protein, partial [Proteobacteria bacterium]|nr:carboxypeptidase-like regulatory domain-containing protein [Pseudomonadota bacterium]